MLPENLNFQILRPALTNMHAHTKSALQHGIQVFSLAGCMRMRDHLTCITHLVCACMYAPHMQCMHELTAARCLMDASH